MQPLAERMRPRELSRVVGQPQLLGEGAPLRTFVEKRHLPSCILWGPPGTGKTTLAMLLASEQKRPFFTLSAVNAGVKDVRQVIEKSKSEAFFDAPSPVLFIDEIHRFSKSQQDALLGAVEKGIIVLIGATTENPSFEVIPALLSRCQVFVLESLGKDDLLRLLDRALKEDDYLKKRDVELKSTRALLRYSGGDARKLFNALDIVVSSQEGKEKVVLDDETTTRLLQENMARYDKSGEQHYDIISAFIKSVRGSDPNGAVYWLARMIEGGEEPEFICRRMIILASEDIGLANPNALLLANACFDSIRRIGMPEGRIIMSQAAVYLACSPKSNSTYMAINKAQAAVRKEGDLPVPLHLRNAPTKLMKELGYGKAYKYSHNYRDHFEEQEYLPDDISGTSFFEPGPFEDKYREWLRKYWKGKYGY